MKNWIWGFLSLVAIGVVSCRKTEGCTDRNANNYDVDADKNTGCVYRYSSTIDVLNVPANNPNGDPWDVDGGPDLKLNFGKNSSSGYDFTTGIAENSTAATLTPTSNIQFTNEQWKYELVDDDVLSASEVIATGTFNPLTQGNGGTITIMNGTISLEFNYNVQ